MRGVRLLFGLLFLSATSVVSADDIDMFKRLQNPSLNVRLASAQDAAAADVSDSFPTQYVDPEDLDDIGSNLIEQEAVPAESAAASVEYVEDGLVIDPIASNEGVACGCGEGPLQDEAWDAAPCCSGVCCEPRCRQQGCHQRRRMHCRHTRPVCEVAAARVCVDPCAVDPCAVAPCVDPCPPAAWVADPCAVCVVDPCVGPTCCCHHHRGCRHGGHLLRHIRCCR